MPTVKLIPAPEGRAAVDRPRPSLLVDVFDDFPSVTYWFDNIPALLPDWRRPVEPNDA